MAHLSMDIKVKGADKIQRKLDREGFLGKALKHALNKAALSVERRAKMFSPVEMGRLKSSWVTKTDASSIPSWSKVGTNVAYAEKVEYSGKSPAAGAGPTERIPFFQPAISESESDIKDALDEAARILEEQWRA